MSAQHEPERFLATEKLAETRGVILRESAALVELRKIIDFAERGGATERSSRDARSGEIAESATTRAKVEKYRESKPQQAHEHYLELQKTQKRLLAALQDAQLALLETEEDALARNAGLLHKGLSGFNLMSRGYKPVYEALTGFAEKLPETGDTVNAQVIGRLMNRVRMGYYPTDPDNIALMLRGIRFPEGVTTNVFDPCCGCGKALRQIAQGNNCFAYGVELDEYRAEEAQTRLHRVGVGSFFHSHISREAFHLMFLNPPYLASVSENGGRTRQEKRFLVESLPHLMTGGLLIYVVPFYRLTPDICRVLSDNFTDISVWRFTGGEFAKFRQVAVFGVRKVRSEDPDAASELERYSVAPDAIPVLTELAEGRYTLPDMPRKVDVFKGERFNEKELERQLAQSDSFRRLINGESELDSGVKRPPLPLSISQIGLIGGSGDTRPHRLRHAPHHQGTYRQGREDGGGGEVFRRGGSPGKRDQGDHQQQNGVQRSDAEGSDGADMTKEGKMRSMTLAVLHTVKDVPGEDDALRTLVWGQTAALLQPNLGKLYNRFEPADTAWEQRVERLYSVVLGRSDPALFMYFYRKARAFQEKAVKYHMNGLMGSLTPGEKIEDERYIGFSAAPVPGKEMELSAHLAWHMGMMGGEVLPDAGIYFAPARQAVIGEKLHEEILRHLPDYAISVVRLCEEVRDEN